MRWIFYGLGLCILAVTFVWSQMVINQTRETLSEVSKLRRDIRHQHEVISVLEAEWAWLNRPARLERLIAQHDVALGLLPLNPDSFADLAEVAMPPIDDGMDPVALIDLDETGPETMIRPAPSPQTVGMAE